MKEDSRMENMNLPKIISTTEAAKALNVHPQTLRKWAKEGSSPLKPIYIGGHMAWYVEDIRKLLCCAP